MVKVIDKLKEKIQSQCTKASEKTREQLLEAARELFSKRGFHGVSVKEICDLAACNVSLVSYHYGGKEGLYRSCIEPLAELETTLTLQDIEDPKSIEEFVAIFEQIAHKILLRIIADPRMFRIVSREMESEDLIIIDIFEKTFHKIFERISGVISLAKDKEWLRNDLDPQVATMMFMGTLLHMIRVEGLRKRLFNQTITEETYRTMVVSQILNIYMNGIRKS